MSTIAELMTRHGVTTKAIKTGERTEERTQPYGKPFKVTMREYSVVFERDTRPGEYKRESASFTYLMGEGIKHEPRGNEVLWSICQDASFFFNNDALYATYENFASEYGYDADSRKGLTIYEACQKNGAKLCTFLGYGAFAELMALVNEGVEE